MKQTVNSTRKQEENLLLASIIESSDSIIYSLDKEGVVTTWNSAAEQLFRFKKQEIIGKKYTSLVAKESHGDMKNTLEKVCEGEVIRSFEASCYTKRKQIIPLGMKISPIRGQSGKVIGVAINARDLRREINFREKEKFLENISHLLGSSLDYSQTLLAIAKVLVPRFADWCSLHIIQEQQNEVQLALTYSGKKDAWIHQSETSPKVTEYQEFGTDQVIQSGKPIMYDVITNNKKNKKIDAFLKKRGIFSVIVVPLISRGKILGTLTLVSTNKEKQFKKEEFELAEELGHRAGRALDNAILFENAQKEILERKKIAEELQRSRNQLQVILENISDGITVQDDKGNLVFVNDAIAKASGYASVKDMRDNPRNWVDRFTLLDETGKELNRADIPTAQVRQGKSTFAQTNIHYFDKKRKESYWSNIKAQGVYDDQKNLQFIVTIIHDITEMQEQEARKDEFISMASHELKTPLTSLIVYLHLLKSKLKKNTEPSNLLQKVEQQTTKLNELVTELLDISRIQSGKLAYAMEQFNLDEVVTDVTQAVQGITTKHTIRINGDRSVAVYGDKNRINQVLTNLLVNAIKYSPDGGQILVNTEKNGVFAKVKVKDSGIGIHKNDQVKIFEKLYQAGSSTEKTFPGLGIGLYIASSIVKRHGGTIHVNSQKGHGATFTFTVPLFLSKK